MIIFNGMIFDFLKTDTSVSTYVILFLFFRALLRYDIEKKNVNVSVNLE